MTDIDECLAGEVVNRHDRCIAEEAAKFYGLAHAFSDDRNQADCRCFLVDHTDGKLICEDSELFIRLFRELGDGQK